MKVCKGCGFPKPNNAEHFRIGHSGSGKSLVGVCKACDNERHRIRYQQTRTGEAIRTSIATARMIRCDKLAHKAGCDAHLKFLLSIERAYKSSAEYEREQYQANPLPKRQRSRKRYAANVESERLRVTLYKHSHPDKIVKWGDKRKRLAFEQADGTLNHSAVGNLFASARRCPYCDRKLNAENKTLDHLVALSRGGAHGIHNVLICCRSCNIRKNDMPFDQWIATLSESCEIRARKIYHQRYGSAPEQAIISLKYA